MPKRTKRIFISDVHMSAGRKPKQGRHDYDWLAPEEANRLAKFIDHVNDSTDIQEVILLGDIMDNWVCPVDEEPITYDEIVKAPKNKNLVASLKKLAKNKEIKVIYMPGNHDMGITKAFIDKVWPEMVFGGSALNDSIFRDGRLLAEHGSAHALFNAPDPFNSPGNRIPLGYYISRVIATKAAKTGSPDRHYWTYIDDLLEIFGPQTLPQSVLEAVLEEAGLDDNTGIRMRTINNKPIYTTAKDIKDKYAKLYSQWEEHKGKGMAFKAVMAEIGWLGDLADHLTKKSDTRIVVFGHSHDWQLDKDSWFVRDRIYANCGAWCDDKKPATFVETERTKDKHYVRVMSWDGTSVKKEDENYV